AAPLEMRRGTFSKEWPQESMLAMRLELVRHVSVARKAPGLSASDSCARKLFRATQAAAAARRIHLASPARVRAPTAPPDSGVSGRRRRAPFAATAARRPAVAAGAGEPCR